MKDNIFDWGVFSWVGVNAIQLIEPLSAFVGLCYLAIRVWESETVKAWRKKKEN